MEEVTIIFQWLLNNISTIFLTLLGIAILVISFGYESQCPSCKKWFAKEKVKDTRIDARTGYQVRDVVTESKNHLGEIVGKHTTQQQFRVLIETWQHHYQCKECEHQWHTQSTTTTENFYE
jgi:hypothetical protein